MIKKMVKILIKCLPSVYMTNSVSNFVLLAYRPQTDPSITDTSTLIGCTRGC